MVMHSTVPGSGGVIIPPEMQRIVDQPGYLNFAKGGQKLRIMYSDQAGTFNPMLLSPFAMDCYTGNLDKVKAAVESGMAPDITGTEGALRFGYATIIVSGKRRIAYAQMVMKHVETLSYLLSRGCPPDVEDITGLTALIHATQHTASSPLDLARILLDAGANVNHRDRYGQVPIQSAFMSNNIPAIELLMEYGADLDIGDADGCIPRAFFVTCGPQVAAAVSKWLRIRSGEEALLAEKQCGKCKISGPDISLKLCSKCRSIKYCSASCQSQCVVKHEFYTAHNRAESHWPTHKRSCHPFSTANTVTLKPYYGELGMVGTLTPTADFTRRALGIPSDPTPERNMRGPRAPKSAESKSKSMVIKVQVPWIAPGKNAGLTGDLMVYNKKRDFICQIRRSDGPAEYDRISQVVRSQGVSGAKAYFAAELVKKDELVVKVSETLTDLNDFITPSQACIKPVEQVKPKENVKEPGGASTEIRIDSTGSYYEVEESSKAGKKLEQAQISLNDCLACSGCITSAESVLITLQSHTEVLNVLAANPSPAAPEHKIPVISIAPQSLASLSAALSSSSRTPTDVRRVLRRVQAFCTQALGFAHAFDTTFARHVALREHAREFAERRAGEGKLPMLASACPGWICYAEKAHAEMLPFISRTKSPQQVMGTLVKEWLGEKWGKKPDEIYHVSVMPCYDKKLEASRTDFHNELYSTRDVDCVITTGELELLMREKEWDLSLPVPGELDPSPDAVFPELMEHPGTSSGSYLHTLIASIMTESLNPLTHTSRTVRGADYEEHTLADAAGAVVFRGATCYGFRNLQNVVRKVGREAGVQVGRGAAGRMGGGIRARMKKGAEERERGYDYVEVMACPGGCVNGGGQLKPPARTRDAEG
ncbi:hypothetical protein HWV62_32862, partial [Athelia sp. TMB]